MNREIVYLMSGPAHLPYLVASLWTLRRHWSGPVRVHAFPESFILVRRIAEDPRLGIEAVRHAPQFRWKRNTQFAVKQLVAMASEADVVLYLDADTTIHGSVKPIFDGAADRGFCATQFCNWGAGDGIARKRILRLLDVSGIPEEHVSAAISGDWPSVNGGVWAARPGSEALARWFEWTEAAKDLFIADECCLHALMPAFVPSGRMDVLLGGAWNCSPREKFQPPNLPDEDVVIRHYHGDSCCRPNKTEKGVRLWWPIYQECLELNVGGIREWRGEIQNKHLDRYELGAPG